MVPEGFSVIILSFLSFKGGTIVNMSTRHPGCLQCGVWLEAVILRRM